MEFEYRRELAGGAILRAWTFDSEILRGNPLGDPTRRSHPVLLPSTSIHAATVDIGSASAASELGAGLPLVVILVGYTGFGHKVLNKGSMWAENLPERIARGMAEGAIPPAVFLWPGCETRLGGSQYLNSTGTGNYEDFVIQELVPAAELEFDCGGVGARILAGKSSGGYGALRLVMRNPGFFTAAASHCGDMGFDMSHFRGFADALTCWQKHGGPEAFLEALPTLKLGHAEHAGIEGIAMASCYSPDSSTTLGARLPVDPDSGEIRHNVFEKWLQHDPLRMVDGPACAQALRDLKYLYLDAGHTDEFALQWGLKRFERKLTELAIPAQVEYFAGGHFDTDWRYEISLPALLKAISTG
jgi:putative esterase